MMDKLKMVNIKSYRYPILSLQQCFSKIVSNWLRGCRKTWDENLLGIILKFYGIEKSLHEACEFNTIVANLFNQTINKSIWGVIIQFYSMSLNDKEPAKTEEIDLSFTLKSVSKRRNWWKHEAYQFSIKTKNKSKFKDRQLRLNERRNDKKANMHWRHSHNNTRRHSRQKFNH